MGFRFRKSTKIGPVRITSSKSGTSFGIGGKGWRVTKRADGRIQTTASIPGTGISWTETTGTKKSRKQEKKLGIEWRILLFLVRHWRVTLPVFVVLLGIGGIGYMIDPDMGADASGTSTAVVSSVEDEPAEPEYLTEIDWAALESYGCAVEVDDYNGDVIASGTWTAEETDTGSIAKNAVPIVWDIFVSDNEYSNISQLQEDECVCTVGGFGSDGQVWEFDVQPGQYLYVRYTDMKGTPVGILHLEKK